MSIYLQQKQREEARWRILRILDAGRPFACNETIIWRTLHDVKLPFTLTEVRRELAYLRDLVLVEILDEKSVLWAAKLTAKGVDVVEYTIDAPPGIARPSQ
jgi:hypothetical protein